MAGVVLVVVAAGGFTYLSLGDPDENPSTTTPVATDTSTSTTSIDDSVTESTMVDVAAETYTDAQLAEVFGDAVYRVETSGCGFEGSGSGFVIDNHHVVTNAHVVDSDPLPTLVSRNGRRLQGRVIGMSEVPDVAVIEVNTELAPVLEWAATSRLAEGDRLVALGYPVPGTDFSATPGAIISFRTADGLREAIRTDASLDRGNSGGPALTSWGGVAGVVTELEDNRGGFQFVPLIYTSAALRQFVENAIANPMEIRSTCGGFVGGSSPPPASSEGGYPDPYDPFWTVVLASVDVVNEGIDKALDREVAVEGLGIPADILLSSDFPSLNPGYWVVYSGRFVTADQARAHCQDIKPLVGSCYHRLVSLDSSQR